MYEPLWILSRQTPLGGEFGVMLNETELPSKHTDASSDDPPNDSQKSLFDCQRSVSFDDETGSPVLPCKEGANGEFRIDMSLQVSQTCAQKLLVASFD